MTNSERDDILYIDMARGNHETCRKIIDSYELNELKDYFSKGWWLDKLKAEMGELEDFTSGTEFSTRRSYYDQTLFSTE
jgi:hypothetical protein